MYQAQWPWELRSQYKSFQSAGVDHRRMLLHVFIAIDPDLVDRHFDISTRLVESGGKVANTHKSANSKLRDAANCLGDPRSSKQGVFARVLHEVFVVVGLRIDPSHHQHLFTIVDSVTIPRHSAESNTLLQMLSVMRNHYERLLPTHFYEYPK